MAESSLDQRALRLIQIEQRKAHAELTILHANMSAFSGKLDVLSDKLDLLVEMLSSDLREKLK